MQITGTMIEIGRIEDEGCADGFVIRRDDGPFVTVKGLRMDEVRALAPHFLDAVGVTIAAAGQAIARDMAIAEAVRDACAATMGGACRSTFKRIDLAAIITTIK